MVWISRTLTRAFHHIRAVDFRVVAAQRIPFRSQPQSDHSALTRHQPLVPFRPPLATALATAGSACACVRAHADGGTPNAGEDERNAEAPLEIKKTNDEPIARIIVHVLMNWMDRSTSFLACGIVGVNALISTSFRLGFYLNEPPKPKPAFITFLCKNFLLSQGWLKRHRWHLFLTSIFTHLSAGHLVRNSAMTILSIMLSSEFLSASDIACLFVAGGLIGKTFSVSLSRALQKHRYLAYHIGGSDGIYALVCFSACAMESDSSREWLTVFRGLLCFGLLSEGVGLRRFIRYGYTGNPNTPSLDHATHLAGALTGLAAYGLKYYWTPALFGCCQKDNTDYVVRSREKRSDEDVVELRRPQDFKSNKPESSPLLPQENDSSENVG